MAKLPYMPFYTNDFMMDERVSAMSLAERGMYISLLCFAWREGSIPESVDAIARILGRPLPEVRRLWAAVSECWMRSADGRLVQRRMEEVRGEIVELRARQSDGGRRGASRRWADRSVNGLPNDSPTGLPILDAIGDPMPSQWQSNTNTKANTELPVVANAPTAASTRKTAKPWDPPSLPSSLPATLPEPIDALKRVAVEFLGAFANSRSPEALKRHGGAYVEALAIFRSRGIGMPETWRAFCDARLARDGQPLFGAEAKKAVSFLAARSSQNGRAIAASMPHTIAPEDRE